ncbi:glycoside hydrolase superfamily [Aspergillus cavernicola]|uniref:non-reducing end alpha-L-arabinofuranosidase n=1 Tax=Aspergillus cavernicola TaxID=176166 RepID=A0ABR4ICN0_9EURO
MKFEFARFLASWPGLGWFSSPCGLVSRQQHSAAPINLTVLRDGGNASSPFLYGIFFEEMDHSGDGGIHGQLLRNNGFQGTDPGLTGYKPLGDVEIKQDRAAPVSAAIPSSLAVSLHPRAMGYVGFANIGYDGVPVMQATYRCEFWMMGEYRGNLILRLTGSRSQHIYGEHHMTVRSRRGQFTRYEARFEARGAPDGENEWQLLFDARGVRGGVLNFGLVQLFPPTYHDRLNGLREDIASVVGELRPAFLRFPGGNNLEGLQIESRWKWNETIGPVVDRPGRHSNWDYPNTDALGLDEYLWWCEDMQMIPVLSIWDGKSYGKIVSGDDLHPFLTDIMNELEYLLGPATTHYGRLRAQNGRTTPWPLQYIEIGNEDDYTGGCDTYPDRLVQIHDTIRAQYPNLTLIANNMEEFCLPVAPLPGLMFDYHYYRTPDQLVAMFDYWDHQPRTDPVIIGEYGARNDSDPVGRNSDIVKMAAYAPLLQHFGFTMWSPTLIGFDSSPDSITPSTSYFVQRMFATNRGNTVHPVNSTAGFGPVYWGATSHDSIYQVKMANYGEESRVVNVRVPGTRAGRLEMLSGPRDVSNLPHNVNIMPAVRDINGSDEVYTVHMAAWAVAVLVVS